MASDNPNIYKYCIYLSKRLQNNFIIDRVLFVRLRFALLRQWTRSRRSSNPNRPLATVGLTILSRTSARSLPSFKFISKRFSSLSLSLSLEFHVCAQHFFVASNSDVFPIRSFFFVYTRENDEICVDGANLCCDLCN